MFRVQCLGFRVFCFRSLGSMRCRCRAKDSSIRCPGLSKLPRCWTGSLHAACFHAALYFMPYERDMHC